jgi:ribonucleotide reductase alpha subunit
MSNVDEMFVTKRDGNRETVSFDKILNRIKKIGAEANIKINYTGLVVKVIDQLFDGISTSKIDELLGEQCISLSSVHPDYGVLASRISISNHHKNTSVSFCEVMHKLYNHTDKNGIKSPIISEELYGIVNKYGAEELDVLCDFTRDYLIDYFGFKTLEKAYLLKIDNTVLERPQHMWLRVSIGMHGDNMEKIKETYYYMSNKFFTMATPTLFNAGTQRQQLSSCFLLTMEDDSVDGIFNTLKDCANISRFSGGIGLSIHNVRAKGSLIRSTNGVSDGIVPMLRLFNNMATYINQSGRRPGSVAVYLEPWHADIEDFLNCRKNHGDEHLRARDLFYGLWVCDLFMERVKTDGLWTLMCPDECRGLADVYGDKFTELYTSYEAANKGRKTIKARELWFQILTSQMETGNPYLVYKDAANKKSNQQNIGTIHSSNLCVAPETMVLTDQGQIGIQELAGQTVNVWNGEQFSAVEVVQTGINQQLMTVETTDGCKIYCTPYHKFYVKTGDVVSIVDADKLSLGQSLVTVSSFPQIDGSVVDDNAALAGDNLEPLLFVNYSIQSKMAWLSKVYDRIGTVFLSANDGETEVGLPDFTQTAGVTIIKDASENILLNNVSGQVDTIVGNLIDVDTGKLFTFSGSFIFDISNGGFSANGDLYTISGSVVDISGQCMTIAGTLVDKSTEGVFSVTGDIQNFTSPPLYISEFMFHFIADDERLNLLMVIKMMLQTCGLHVDVLNKNICLNYSEICFLYGLGFSPTKLSTISSVFSGETTTTQLRQPNVVVNFITYNSRVDNTYCFNEPLLGRGVFNGILTGQCTEIIQYSDATETAVCNLASIALPSFIEAGPVFNFEKLHEVAKIVTYNLNRVIDINFYPTEKTRKSNLRHRPVGIGIQGLADLFILMNLSFTCDEAKTLNKQVFETIYHAALEQSCSMAETDGAYETFAGSPASEGRLQFDLWGETEAVHESGRYDWVALKKRICEKALRNSLLVAPMPTASTSQILGFNECIEPITSNIYNRRTNAGEFILANKYLMNDLIKLGLWNETVKNSIIANNGSVQHIDAIPAEIREKYRTVWEIPMRHLIDMAADRGIFICQSQSLNLWIEDPNYSTLTSMHYYAWQRGLKTGIYYLRRRAKHQAQKFTVEPEKRAETDGQLYEDEHEACETCSA